MEKKVTTPIKLVLPTVKNPPPPAPPPCEGEGSGSEVVGVLPLSLPWERGPGGEGESPRFIPLAVAIDLGMTPPIGSIRTTEVELRPSDAGKPPRPMRRHLRLLPSSGA